jgi:hypothetical protein
MKKCIFTFIILLNKNLVFRIFTYVNLIRNPKYSGNIRNFDREVRAVKNILNNEMIFNSVKKNWNKKSEDGLQLNTTIYIFWMKVFSGNFYNEPFKEVIIISR